MRLIDADLLKSEVRNAVPITMDSVYCLIDNQPTVNEWVLCSERFPKENGNFIVTVKDYLNNGIITQVSAWLKSYERFECEDKYQSVTAWKPLPQPYIEDNNNGEK